MKLHLPERTPSLNQWQRMHWAKRARLKKRLTREVAWLFCGAPASGKRHVIITRHSPRKLDHDNLVGGCKPLVDALVACGALVDDDPESVSVEYRQSAEPSQGVTVELSDVILH